MAEESLNRYPIIRYDTRDLYKGYVPPKDMPGYIYCRGNILLLQKDVVAVIGSRDISDRGRAITKNIVQALYRRGKTVLNGLAIGCDTIAVQETLGCGGKAIAVLPCGLDEIYPKSNLRLATSLLEQGGCLISEYPEGVRPRKDSFVARDRLQALFSNPVIVVESRPMSGTWHTVEYARKYRKVVACYIDQYTEQESGNSILVKDRKAYALRDNAGMDYILDVSQNNYQQMSLFA